jgi:hypothetical protein
LPVLFHSLAVSLLLFLFQQLLSPLSPAKSERVLRFVEWYKDHIGTMNEGFMCWLLPLLCELGIVPEGEKPVFHKETVPTIWDRNLDGEVFVPDEYVLDKHTSKGRGKGLIEFAVEGSKVENQASFVRPLWKQFYEDGKFFEEAGLAAVKGEIVRKLKKPTVGILPLEAAAANEVLESRAFTFLVRTQITTMGSKMDVYLAKDAHGKVVVVKGPYASYGEINSPRVCVEFHVLLVLVQPLLIAQAKYRHVVIGIACVAGGLISV